MSASLATREQPQATPATTTTQTARFRRGDRVLVRAGNIVERNVCREARVTEAPSSARGIYLLQLIAGGWLCAYQRDIEPDPDNVDIIAEGLD